MPSTELDGFIELKADQPARLGERGDSPWRPGKMLRLKPGDSWRRAGVTCAIAPAKRMVKCLNAGGDGFLIGPNAYKLLSSI